MAKVKSAKKSLTPQVKQVARYLNQKTASRASLKPQEASPSHHLAEAKFLLNKTVQKSATKKLAEHKIKSK